MNRLLLAAAALAALVSCTPAPVLPSSSGSLAVSRDNLTLYVADADHDRVTLLDAKSGAVLKHVAVARGPERLAVSPDDGAVFVTSKGARTVTRLTADGEVVATGAVGAEPVGLSLSSDGRRLFVANSQSGTVSELEATTLEPRAELEVGGNPHAVAVHPDGDRVYVADFLGARVNVFSRLRHGTVATATLEQPPSAECQGGFAAGRTPSQAADVVISGDGQRVYVGHTQSRTGADGLAQGLAFAVAPALSTVSTETDGTLREPDNQRPLGVDTLGGDERPDFPAPILATGLDDQCVRGGGGNGMDAPSSLVVDPLGEWIFVADHNSNAVAVVSATRRNDPSFESPERGIFGVVRVGARPTGIAVSSDLKKAWVHNALDYSVSVVELKGGRLEQTQVLEFGQSALPPAVERGRRLFYSAVDERLTEPTLGGVSCSSCHPDGRTDGLSWALANNPNSWEVRTQTRNTPPLWRLAQTAPYAWSGAMPDLPSFTTHMVDQMGGDGLNKVELADIAAYMTTLEPPDNGVQLSTEAAAHGQALFTKACAGCHAGAALTDGQRHLVGGQLLDTPSLIGARATPPYLHNGSARTLEAALGHGTGALGSADAQALADWLRTK